MITHTRRKRPGSKPQLNITSMIDVIFLLLIYFVATASFAKGEGVITANLPGPPPPEQLPALPIRVTVDSIGFTECRLRIKQPGGDFPQAPRNHRDLANILRQFRDHTKVNPPVLIQPAGAVRWQHVVNAFNAAVKAKFENVSFAAVEDER